MQYASNPKPLLTCHAPPPQSPPRLHRAWAPTLAPGTPKPSHLRSPARGRANTFDPHNPEPSHQHSPSAAPRTNPNTSGLNPKPSHQQPPPTAASHFGREDAALWVSHVPPQVVKHVPCHKRVLRAVAKCDHSGSTIPCRASSTRGRALSGGTVLGRALDMRGRALSGSTAVGRTLDMRGRALSGSTAVGRTLDMRGRARPNTSSAALLVPQQHVQSGSGFRV
jgi:hypothetical protein